MFKPKGGAEPRGNRGRGTLWAAEGGWKNHHCRKEKKKKETKDKPKIQEFCYPFAAEGALTLLKSKERRLESYLSFAFHWIPVVKGYHANHIVWVGSLFHRLDDAWSELQYAFFSWLLSVVDIFWLLLICIERFPHNRSLLKQLENFDYVIQ